ncbi:dUTP diphosphatase [Candidatus Berkelbacteria bacterium CG10_big_fil_rev_8_21_14_0_10_43_13]|uniref:dUTP diphosphatase n=1 Tax=Candidatus Berkelbacteria bacterium CG10_big_fil_rev_8_21_14_0_10_43_13 TaxID=1974514 RepID=A0A2H0W8P5_9BACT|nr:MAG: dUTP diphosphatase [Candidatus Berkelbacteria bacterium CG10_big_fil_rev_8_21_14_0_10_43_13]
MEIKVKKIDPTAKLPSFAHADDAGLDLYSRKEYVVKPDNQVYKIDTGIAFEIPTGFVGLIWDKSGISLKGIKTVGGVIDAGYRGEVTASVINLSKSDYVVNAGDKIAQILIQKVEHPEIVQVDELSNSKRGVNRYGSTGK